MICTMAIHSPTTMATVTADAPVLGQGDVIERPMAPPNVRNKNERAAAPMAPPSTGPQSRYGVRTADATPGMGCAMLISPSTQADEGEHGHDDNDQSDEIDDAVHCCLQRSMCEELCVGLLRHLDGEARTFAAAQ